ncbi:MAG TPA: biosynthetic-type acetolactate synthase large subunit [Candidatus Gallacutalibacter pullicola]|uniref:Acetolactate synthase n=1 Tax=Candidatus Gallacutalibacter pullicola TaxID=2840830 RepID=A0A9D1DQI6_9FIRM|nr:biosynthetic-type acetolactate synthase large subunit [Candidatus Gallacutalibacter pullicola]
MLLTGAEIIMECLLEQKVDTVFGYPGGAMLNIYDALYQYGGKLRHIETSHEQNAAHAADGYARATGKTGVCIATSGPGATNLVTGIATAYMDSIPMVAITGNVNLGLLGLDSFQEVDITGITMPVTKHNFIVKDVSQLADTLRKAFRIAQEGRKGPVLVDIPKDITAQKCEFTPLAQLPEPEPEHFPSDQSFERAMELIRKSERPFLYTGGGVIASEASEELAALAERLDAPVASSLMSQGAFDQSSPRYMGMLGMHGTKTAALGVKHCDLFIAVGTRFSDRVTCNADLFGTHFPIIQIDIDPAEFDKNVHVDVRLRGDAKQILSHLLEIAPQMDHADWMRDVESWNLNYPLMQRPAPDGVTPQEVLGTLGRLTDSEAILTTEVGQHQMWAAQFYTFRHPRQFLTSGGLGTMGFGLGAAMGAQLARPDKRVINIAGDGSFHMNCSELSTLSKYNIPVIELIFNNTVLGMVRQWQKLFYENRFSQTDLEKKTDYEMLARAFGVKALTIREQADIEPVLKEALATDGPVLINCLINKDINVLPMVPAGASVEDPILTM